MVAAMSICMHFDSCRFTIHLFEPLTGWNPSRLGLWRHGPPTKSRFRGGAAGAWQEGGHGRRWSERRPRPGGRACGDGHEGGAGCCGGGRFRHTHGRSLGPGYLPPPLSSCRTTQGKNWSLLKFSHQAAASIYGCLVCSWTPVTPTPCKAPEQQGCPITQLRCCGMRLH